VTFRVLWAFDAIVSAVFLYFFVVGLGDGSVSSFNMGLWVAILAVLAGVLGGGLMLKARRQRAAALALLALLAIPSALVGLFFLILIVANPRWN
jgi:hypothetical protein